jgi:hypothetical protein
MDPRRGYALAVLNMLISGVTIYVNSLSRRRREETVRLKPPQVALLLRLVLPRLHPPRDRAYRKKRMRSPCAAPHPW